jgi:hypothetical protein
MKTDLLFWFAKDLKDLIGFAVVWGGIALAYAFYCIVQNLKARLATWRKPKGTFPHA